MSPLKVDEVLLDCVVPAPVGASRFSQSARSLSALVGLTGQCNG